ncbi:MAG: FAD-dependent monooxygenase [Pseudomonadota bacterium]
MTTSHKVRTDILIAGGSFTGLTLGLALSQTFGQELAVTIAGVEEVALRDDKSPRAFALSAASKSLLEVLGLWDPIASEAQPIHAIELTDSPLTAGIRPVHLTYSNVLDDDTAASFIVPSHVLAQALLARCIALQADGVIRLTNERVSEFCTNAGHAQVVLGSGQDVEAKLVVSSEGRESALRTAAGLDTVQFSHDQLGIVTTVQHEKPHNGTAVQHFLPAGPFAILPLPGNRSCVTWSEELAEAQRIMELPEADFLAELDQRFAGRYGAVRLDGERRSFPLKTQIARKFAAERIVLVGDSAHAVHPIAGQGLNLAFRDVAALTECLVNGVSVGLDVADPVILENYESWRRFDSVLSAGVFAGINKLFANDWSLLRSVREVGLGAVQQVDGLKAFFVRHAAGRVGEMPKLLVGERLSF